MSLLVTGSIALDSVNTPYGTAKDVLGGTAVYFSAAARFFTPTRLVGVVGEDFPEAFREVLSGLGVDLAGLETRRGSKTFRWSGRFMGDMAQAETLDVHLNVLAEAGPKVPDKFADSEVVFLANTHPALQRDLQAQLSAPDLVVCDTMNLWIEREREELLRTLANVDGLIVNDAEARDLTGCANLIEAGEKILTLGPEFAVIKKGEHGAVLFAGDRPTAIPAYPTKNVKDPTGAGDSFAGGMLGYLASLGEYGPSALRQALVRGTVTSSFTIESFSLERLLSIQRRDIDERVQEFLQMLRMD